MKDRRNRASNRILAGSLKSRLSHNRRLEEDQMWSVQDRLKRISQQSSAADGGASRRLHMDSERRPASGRAPSGRSQADARPEIVNRARRCGPESLYWTKKLLDHEEKDPDRWGHSGFRELYVDNASSLTNGDGAGGRDTRTGSQRGGASGRASSQRGGASGRAGQQRRVRSPAVRSTADRTGRRYSSSSSSCSTCTSSSRSGSRRSHSRGRRGGRSSSWTSSSSTSVTSRSASPVRPAAPAPSAATAPLKLPVTGGATAARRPAVRRQPQPQPLSKNAGLSLPSRTNRPAPEAGRQTAARRSRPVKRARSPQRQTRSPQRRVRSSPRRDRQAPPRDRSTPVRDRHPPPRPRSSPGRGRSSPQVGSSTGRRSPPRRAVRLPPPRDAPSCVARDGRSPPVVIAGSSDEAASLVQPAPTDKITRRVANNRPSKRRRGQPKPPVVVRKRPDSPAESESSSSSEGAAPTRGGLSARFGRLAQLGSQPADNELVRLRVVRDAGAAEKRVILEEEPRTTAAASRTSTSAERVSFETEYRECFGRKLRRAEAPEDPADGRPRHLPRDWNTDVTVRYRYYRDAGYFRDRQLSLDEYVKWEHWWYRYRQWLNRQSQTSDVYRHPPAYRDVSPVDEWRPMYSRLH